MKTVGMLIVGPGEGVRYLTECLDGLSRLVDEVSICLNRTQDDGGTTELLCREYGSFKRVIWRDDREWGIHQPSIKTDHLARTVARLKPDWVLAVDADEALTIDRPTLEALVSQPHDLAYYFWCLDLWDKPDTYREDFLFEDVRLFRACPDRPMSYRGQALHCGMAPPYAYNWGTRTPFAFLHYGLIDRADRERRHARYRKYDPRGVYHPQSWYDALLATNPPLTHVSNFPMKADGMAFRSKPAPAPKEPAAPRKVWAFLTKHGRKVIAEDEKTRDFYKTLSSHTYIGEEDLIAAGAEAPVVDKPPVLDTASEPPRAEGTAQPAPEPEKAPDVPPEAFETKPKPAKKAPAKAKKPKV